LSERDSRRRMDAGAQFARKADSAIESLAKSQVLRVLVSEPARIFYIVKRGLTWGFSSRNATQVSLSEKCRLPWSAVFKPPAVGSISMKIWS
jgi:hypothetical protein